MDSGISNGASGAGLRAALMAAIAYDEVCCACQLQITFTPQAIIINGRAMPAAANRAREIIQEIIGSAPVWDRTIST
ncbi:hypothetical protein [Shinella oryzae]|uniref:Uncharacterized protein n=1 Tax=Shinella oryzae TaxID=2871820 RepID=A0ABY9K9P7_9HYPH|nr:hypothetical protein [Shinella oryzae]WLS05270.1 hypothetical protein Q9315_24280 [Shinella oryzae]